MSEGAQASPACPSDKSSVLRASVFIWITGKVTLKMENGCARKNEKFFQCHFVHHKSHMN